MILSNVLSVIICNNYKKMAFAFFIAFLIGCAAQPIPLAPNPPGTRWQLTEEVVRRDIPVPSSEWVSKHKSLEGKIIGIRDFGGDPSGGPLASQQVAQKLLKFKSRYGLKEVIDRSQINTIKSELELRDGNFTNLSDKDQAKRIGKLISADYILDGNVIEYSSDQKIIALQRVFKRGEYDRYESEYNDFVSELLVTENKIKSDLGGKILATTALGKPAQDQLAEIRRLRKDTLTPDAIREDLEYKQKSETRNIVSVGIAARLINVNTGEYMWLYNVEDRGFSTTETMDNAVDKLIGSLFQHTEQKI
ncbi:penicillin-binding protein activator LpoB [Sessilibacter corallicola]|uniref:penicillin-binding protein activator LpoB n=1 Tax=Sessilibacter corallicola TaxID=2904075 RepID=UPI001E457704|nr:penicillin-binding protein activator LpoB [Sessilibacter corallicola]MCE2030367.1 penicillin-binding protein activator LpoB [Sessilibacter corallicola]